MNDMEISHYFHKFRTMAGTSARALEQAPRAAHKDGMGRMERNGKWSERMRWMDEKGNGSLQIGSAHVPLRMGRVLGGRQGCWRGLCASFIFSDFDWLG